MNRDEVIAMLGEDTVAQGEALIGKSIEDFTIDDLQRCVDTLNANTAAAGAEINVLQPGDDLPQSREQDGNSLFADEEFVITLPAFLEVQPGSFKALEVCLRREIESEIRWLNARAEMLAEELAEKPSPSIELAMEIGELIDRAKSLDWYLEKQAGDG